MTDHNKICKTEGCHRKAELLFTAALTADGEVLPEGEEIKRSFCRPCKRAANWLEPWPPSERGWKVIVDE